ncbi:MAG: hypothetical protein WBK26_15270 [Burkholderiaceae bacterium]
MTPTQKQVMEQAVKFCEAWPAYGGRELAGALRAALAEPAVEPTYTSTQATTCASCGEHKHTPLRIDKMGGYVCLTCIDQKLGSLLGEFGYPEETSAVEPVAVVDANDDGYWAEILPDRGVKVGQLLYASPPPPAEAPLLTLDEMDMADPMRCVKFDAIRVEFARNIEQAVLQKARLQ